MPRTKKKKMGRPVGSKNKKKSFTLDPAQKTFLKALDKYVRRLLK